VHIVIFRSTRSLGHDDSYAEWAARTELAVAGVPGYVSHFGFRDASSGEGVTVAYFSSEEAVVAWRDHPDHVRARELGRELFYDDYSLEIAVLERGYAWKRESE
jgi:heme-degrading monooxygenase HmoA